MKAYEDEDDDDLYDEADYVFSGSFTEIREEMDSSDKVVKSEVVDLSKQLDHFQQVINNSAGRSDTDSKSSESKTKKQQELIDQLRETLRIENSVDQEAERDPHFKFVKEIAQLQEQAKRNVR